MRRAFQDIELITHEGRPVALSLGFDFISEHEWGIGGIRTLCGCQDDAIGIERRRIDPQTVSRFLCLEAKGGVTALGVVTSKGRAGKEPFPDHKMLGDKPYCSFWDEREFLLKTSNPEVAEVFRDLHSAILAGNAAVMSLNIARNNPFSRNSLAIAIIDRLPPDFITDMAAADLEVISVQEDFEATGIEATLQKVGRKWFALSPKRVFDRLKDKTKHSVVVWLNPYDQHSFEAGWFTIEELQDWAKGRGPVMKKSA